MLARLTHGEPLQLRLFATGDHVDQIPCPEALTHNIQETIPIRRKIDSDDLALLHESVIDEAGGLVTVSVMILSPHMTGQKHIQRCNRLSPGVTPALFEPLGMLG